MRYYEDAQAVRDRGGLVIRVNRPLKMRFPDLWEKFRATTPAHQIHEDGFRIFMSEYVNDHVLDHISEVELDDYQFDMVVDNDGDEWVLAQRTQNLVWQLKNNNALSSSGVSTENT